MGHDTAIHAVIGRHCVWIIRVDPKDNAVRTRLASTKDIAAVENGKLPQLLTVALLGEVKSLNVAEPVWVATCGVLVSPSGTEEKGFIPGWGWLVGVVMMPRWMAFLTCSWL